MTPLSSGAPLFSAQSPAGGVAAADLRAAGLRTAAVVQRAAGHRATAVVRRSAKDRAAAVVRRAPVPRAAAADLRATEQTLTLPESANG